MSKITPSKPVLILLYGFPGSGKTFFARQLAEHIQCAHVQNDRIRYELFEEPRFDKQENQIVTSLMDYMTEEFLSAGVSVIYDVNAFRKSQRFNLRDMARKKGAKTIVVWLQIDAETAFARLQKRDRRRADDRYAMSYTKEAFQKFAAHMQHPDLEDFVVISGKHTFGAQKNMVIKRLYNIGVIDAANIKNTVAKPGLVNLIPNANAGRVDMTRRNVTIR
jgi:predicted kinase